MGHYDPGLGFLVFMEGDGQFLLGELLISPPVNSRCSVNLVYGESPADEEHFLFWKESPITEIHLQPLEYFWVVVIPAEDFMALVYLSVVILNQSGRGDIRRMAVEADAEIPDLNGAMGPSDMFEVPADLSVNVTD